MTTIRYAHAAWEDDSEMRRLWITHAHAVLTRPQSDPFLTDEELAVVQLVTGHRDTSTLTEGVGFDCTEEGNRITMCGVGAPNTDLMVRLIQAYLCSAKRERVMPYITIDLHVADVPEDISTEPPKLWRLEVREESVRIHTASKDAMGKAYKYGT
jgi:hypothetical protein